MGDLFTGIENFLHLLCFSTTSAFLPFSLSIDFETRLAKALNQKNPGKYASAVWLGLQCSDAKSTYETYLPEASTNRPHIEHTFCCIPFPSDDPDANRVAFDKIHIVRVSVKYVQVNNFCKYINFTNILLRYCFFVPV